MSTTVHETDDIYRLYRREWVTVHTCSEFADRCESLYRQAQEYYETYLLGRVLDSEVLIVMNTDNAQPPLFWAHVQVFKDNLKGEFKYAKAAERFARDSGWEEYTVVPRNSKDDHRIRSYGVTKL